MTKMNVHPVEKLCVMTERVCPVYLYSVLSSVTNTKSRTQQEATHGPLYKQACLVALPNHCFQPAPWVFETALKSVSPDTSPGFSRQEHTAKNMDERFEFKNNRQQDFPIDFVMFSNIIRRMMSLIQCQIFA